MDKTNAKRMLEKAREHVGEDLYIPRNFEDVGQSDFLRVYLWVIYVSGFRNSVVAKHFDAIKAAFHNLDLDKIVAMESIDAGTLSIRHQKKADAFLRGCKMIHAEGWHDFKQRLKERRRAALQDLPWIGPATGQHMAMVLGLEDTEKADTWMKQCADACSATVDQMVTFLSREYGLTRQQVDGYLWRYCLDNREIP
ncbi:MAG: hypothetical protein OXF88_13050 [Rhodobacteraceae bacterium]|nr:hypothetical protein [Paracoccaceae bacterium]MCY4140790.1 hypothetical protein [Paracoccaceae bacterium]